jgi:hypothetical protein
MMVEYNNSECMHSVQFVPLSQKLQELQQKCTGQTCMFHVSLQLLLKTFFALTDIRRVMPEIHAGTNVGLNVKKTVQSKSQLTV